MSSPTFVAAGTLGTVNGTDSSAGTAPGNPAGITSGDVMFLHVQAHSSTPGTVVNTPSGWLVVPNCYYAITANHTSAVYYRVATGSNPVPTVTQTVSGLLETKISAYRGCDPTTPFDVDAVRLQHSSTLTGEASSITTVSLATTAVFFWSVPDDVTLSSPTFGTSAYNEPTTVGADGCLASAYVALAAAGASGTSSRTQTANGPDNWVCFTVALRGITAPAPDPTGAWITDDNGTVTTAALEVAWGQGPFTPDPVWTDETAYLVNDSVTTFVGRNDEFSDPAAGTFSATLRSDDRRYDPDFAAGPYFGKLVPNVLVRWRTKRSSTVTDHFYGLVQSWPQTYIGDDYAQVTIQALDISSVMAKQVPPTRLQLAVLDDDPIAYWPMDEDDSGGFMVDHSGLSHDGHYYWFPTTDAATGCTPIDSPLPSERQRKAHLIREPVAGVTDDLVLSAPATDIPILMGAELWMQCAPMTSGRVVFLFASTNNYFEFRFEPSSDTTVLGTFLTLNIGDALGITSSIVAQIQPVLSHVVAVIDAAFATCNLYINGALAGSVDVSAQTFDGGSYTFNAVGVETQGQSYMQVAHMALYDYQLSQSQIVDHYEAGLTGGAGETVAERCQALALFGGLFDANLYDPTDLLGSSSTVLGAADFQSDLLAEFRKLVIATEQGRLFVSGSGQLTPQSRAADMNQASQITLAELTAAPNLGYVGFDSDPATKDLMRNQVDVTVGGATITVVDKDLQQQFGVLSEQIDTALPSTVDAQNLGAYRIRLHGQPTSRIKSVVIEPQANPALMPFCLSVQPGDRITVQLTPVGIAPTIERDYMVEGVGKTFGTGQLTVDLYCAPAPETVTGRPWMIFSPTAAESLFGDDNFIHY